MIESCRITCCWEHSVQEGNVVGICGNLMQGFRHEIELSFEHRTEQNVFSFIEDGVMHGEAGRRCAGASRHGVLQVFILCDPVTYYMV